MEGYLYCVSSVGRRRFPVELIAKILENLNKEQPEKVFISEESGVLYYVFTFMCPGNKYNSVFRISNEPIYYAYVQEVNAIIEVTTVYDQNLKYTSKEKYLADMIEIKTAEILSKLKEQHLSQTRSSNKKNKIPKESNKTSEQKIKEQVILDNKKVVEKISTNENNKSSIEEVATKKSTATSKNGDKSYDTGYEVKSEQTTQTKKRLQSKNSNSNNNK